MAILTMLFRKMAKNRWLVAGLLAGMCMCTALTSSMPIYRDASLQRMLTKELERHYEQTSTYPGSIVASGTPNFQPDSADRQAAFLRSYDEYWEKEVLNEPSLSLLDYIRERQTATFRIRTVDPARMDPEENHSAKIGMRSGIEDHVRLVDGRFPSPEPQDGVYEALVTDSTLVKLGIVLGVELVSDDKEWKEQIRIKPVGVIAESDLNDKYWDFVRLSAYTGMFIVNETLFESEIVERAKAPIASVKWEASFDYGKFTLASAIRLTELKQGIDAVYKERMSYNSSVRMPAEPILSVYEAKEAALESLLWSLNVPLYILVAFYLYMVSGLLVEKQRPEIAVLRSRGAGRWQLIALFAMESAALSAVALLAGPFLGAALTAVLGSSDSFMSFVNRKALPVRIDAESFGFSGAAAAFSFLVYCIPVFLATRFSIVDHKRASARDERASFWHRFGLDAAMLAVSLYGLYTFRKRITEMSELGLEAGAIATDPLLFAVPSMFILGMGLALLRLYPWFVKLVYWLGKSGWSASQYSSLLQVGRRSRQYHLLMMFLILTVGTGLFSASAARTINGNLEDQIWYAQGADIVLRQDWIDDAPPPAGPGEARPPAPDRINYLEPDFGVFSQLPGVKRAARVFAKSDAFVSVEEGTSRAQLIGIHTEEFGSTSWMKDGLLPYHFYEYLNLIAPDPRAVLVSRSLAETYELEPGDVIDVGWNDTSPMQATVYGVIDYFPTYNPNPLPDAGDEAPKPMLVVGHLETIQNELALEPYDVWIDLASPDDREALFTAMDERNLRLVSIADSYERIADSRGDPFRMAMNGVMSLGFLLSLAITFIGFLLYWVLVLQGRTLQFGIFRAMGLTFRNIVGMLGTEQLLTSGAAFLIGLLSGGAASFLFVPLFQLSFDPGRIVPPFQVMIESSDTAKLLLFIASMLAIALVALAVSLRKVKLHQALKLGED